MNKRRLRQEKALARLEAQLPKTFTIPMSEKNKTLWIEIIRLRKSLNRIEEIHVVVNRGLHLSLL